MSAVNPAKCHLDLAVIKKSIVVIVLINAKVLPSGKVVLTEEKALIDTQIEEIGATEEIETEILIEIQLSLKQFAITVAKAVCYLLDHQQTNPSIAATVLELMADHQVQAANLKD